MVEKIAELDSKRNVDLILVNTPLTDYSVSRRNPSVVTLPPFGLGYLATVAREKSHNVGLLDAEMYAVPNTQISALLNTINPRYAGLNMFTPSRTQVLSIAKTLNNTIGLVVGGPHASAMPERTLRELTSIHPNSVIVSNEAENAITTLLDGQDMHSIPNAIWLNGKGIIQTNNNNIPKNLDSLPFINRQFLLNEPSSVYLHSSPQYRVLTGRGCPFDCTFCSGAKNQEVPLRR